MTKSKRTFSSLVRMPYQDAIAVTLHCRDYHIEMAVKQPSQKQFHLRQAERLYKWIKDMKDFIVQEEIDEQSIDTESVKTDSAIA